MLFPGGFDVPGEEVFPVPPEHPATKTAKIKMTASSVDNIALLFINPTGSGIAFDY
jgi:hypothetical protein